MAAPAAKKSRRPPPGQPPPETPEEMALDGHKRLVRLETRVGRLIEHHGLDSQGNSPPTGDPPILFRIEAILLRLEEAISKQNPITGEPNRVSRD